jgi:hypothetical protein
MKNFYYHINSGNAAFVKTEKFFIDQGGLTEPWGKAWTKIQARSLDHAREIADSKRKRPTRYAY